MENSHAHPGIASGTRLDGMSGRAEATALPS